MRFLHHSLHGVEGHDTDHVDERDEEGADHQITRRNVLVVRYLEVAADTLFDEEVRLQETYPSDTLSGEKR